MHSFLVRCVSPLPLLRLSPQVASSKLLLLPWLLLLLLLLPGLLGLLGPLGSVLQICSGSVERGV
jgi:hypothetical protein